MDGGTFTAGRCLFNMTLASLYSRLYRPRRRNSRYSRPRVARWREQPWARLRQPFRLNWNRPFLVQQSSSPRRYFILRQPSAGSPTAQISPAPPDSDGSRGRRPLRRRCFAAGAEFGLRLRHFGRGHELDHFAGLLFQGRFGGPIAAAADQALTKTLLGTFSIGHKSFWKAGCGLVVAANLYLLRSLLILSRRSETSW